MVNNKLKILDAGEIKFCPEVIEMKQQNLYSLVLQKKSRTNIISEWSDESGDFIKHTAHNDNYKEPTPRILYALKKYDEYHSEWDWINYPKGPQKLDEKFINWCGGEDNVYDYLEIIPFTPSVMINISPDWKESKLTTEFGKTVVLKKIINDYMQEGWYDKWEYVIECGSNGDHIHAHIVAHVNPDRIKSCIDGFTYKYIKGKKVKKNTSHIGKCNHVNQLKKYAKKVKGIEGCIKGNSIQSTILRNETLVDDKLKYLIEEHKPDGHKNHHIIEDGYVSGCL
jgi:hypothetical protein